MFPSSLHPQVLAESVAGRAAAGEEALRRLFPEDCEVRGERLLQEQTALLTNWRERAGEEEEEGEEEGGEPGAVGAADLIAAMSPPAERRAGSSRAAEAGPSTNLHAAFAAVARPGPATAGQLLEALALERQEKEALLIKVAQLEAQLTELRMSCSARPADGAASVAGAGAQSPPLAAGGMWLHGPQPVSGPRVALGVPVSHMPLGTAVAADPRPVLPWATSAGPVALQPAPLLPPRPPTGGAAAVAAAHAARPIVPLGTAIAAAPRPALPWATPAGPVALQPAPLLPPRPPTGGAAAVAAAAAATHAARPMVLNFEGPIHGLGLGSRQAPYCGPGSRVHVAHVQSLLAAQAVGTGLRPALVVGAGGSRQQAVAGTSSGAASAAREGTAGAGPARKQRQPDLVDGRKLIPDLGLLKTVPKVGIFIANIVGTFLPRSVAGLGPYAPSPSPNTNHGPVLFCTICRCTSGPCQHRRARRRHAGSCTCAATAPGVTGPIAGGGTR